MARSIADIKAAIVAQKNAESALSDLNSNSQSAIWNLWAFIVATAINLHEQLIDLLVIQVETIAASAIVGTPKWLKDRCLKFQFGDVVQVNPDFSVGYPTVDPTKYIITQASVKQGGNRIVTIKVAKGVSPTFSALSAVELAAFTSYIDKIKFAGTQTVAISLPSDKLKIVADIYYDGQYVQTTVKANVITAINTYLQNIPFDGVITLNGLIDAMQGVAGVTDVVFTDVIARPDVIPLISIETIKMVTAGDWLARNYEASAGYIVGETTGGSTLNDTLNMILD